MLFAGLDRGISDIWSQGDWWFSGLGFIRVSGKRLCLSIETFGSES